MPEKSKDEILAEMDVAATEAEAELKLIPESEIRPVADWWRKHYLKAGHKRLGRILIKQ
jgi:hypothetical protein